MIKIELNISVQPNQRPRTRIIKTKTGATFGWIYTPKETEESKKMLKYKYKKYMLENNLNPIPDKVKIKVKIKIYTQKKFNFKIGDIDNYYKTITDAGNKILWHDDYQISEIECIRISNAPKNKIILIIESLEQFLI